MLYIFVKLFKRLMEHTKETKHISTIIYTPTKEIYVFLRQFQTEYATRKLKVGLSRVIDICLAKYINIVKTKDEKENPQTS